MNTSPRRLACLPACAGSIGSHSSPASPFFSLPRATPHYSTLLKFDTAHYPQIVGDLAQSWDVSADRRTYTFKLRDNVLFHDGSRLTSEDVKASYDRIIHPPQGVLSVRQADYSAITDVETPDPMTVVFHLQWPDAAMLANFASPWNCIYNAAKLKEDPLFPKTHVLGTGPFVFELGGVVDAVPGRSEVCQHRRVGPLQMKDDRHRIGRLDVGDRGVVGLSHRQDPLRRVDDAVVTRFDVF